MYQFVLEQIKKGDSKTTEDLYKKCKAPFVVWVSKQYGISESTANDLYQQAFMAMYKNIQSGKLIEFTAAPKTYLFGVARNYIKQHFRQSKKSLELLDFKDYNEDAFAESFNEEEERKKHNMMLVEQLLKKLDNSCSKLLRLSFLKNYSSEALVREMAYKNEGVVRKKKSLCMKALREQVKGKNFKGFF